MKKLKGKVILQDFGQASKSAHKAVFLDTGSKIYRLKKIGGNAFYDASLHELVGKHIKAEGNITDHFFEISGEPEEII